MDNQVKLVKEFYTRKLRDYYLNLYKFYRTGQGKYCDEFQFDNSQAIEWESLDEKLQYFNELLAISREVGTVYIDIYEVRVEDWETTVYRITTDGNDGWIFIFDRDGKLLAAGQTYIEVIVWADSSLLEKYSDIEEFLKDYWGGMPAFLDAHKQTFWGKPLEEIDENYKHTSDYSEIATSIPLL